MATAAAARVFENFINGEWVAAKSGEILENRNPANTDEIIGEFPLSGPEDVNAAVFAARNARWAKCLPKPAATFKKPST